MTPQAEAERLAVTLLVTGCAVTAKVPVVEPEGTDIVEGTVTPGARSEANATVNPAGGAAWLIVIVPVIVPPPYAGEGRTEKPVRLIALIVKVAVCVLAPIFAVIVAEVFAPDVCVVDTANVPVVDPAGIVSEPATVADAALDVSVTVVALACAGVIVTVPDEEKPAYTVLGFSTTDVTVCAMLKHGTSSARIKNRNFIGDLMILRSFVICSVCGIDAPQNRIRMSLEKLPLTTFSNASSHRAGAMHPQKENSVIPSRRR